MNRIYQGRVTRVETLDGQELPKSVLWEHHKLFQDAVNYYTLALAAMAAGAIDSDGQPTPMSKFAKQVKERWDDFDHKGKRRAGLRRSVSTTFGVPLDQATWEPQIPRIKEL